jgi:hypothetical protein
VSDQRRLLYEMDMAITALRQQDLAVLSHCQPCSKPQRRE